MHRKKEILVIGVFALLHAATSFACRKIGIGDDMLLTLLTMLMTFIICIEHKVSSRFMVISVVVVNLIGLVLGVGLAILFKYLSLAEYISHPLATLLCTAVIGLVVDKTATMKSQDKDDSSSDVFGGNVGYYVVAFVVAIILRLIAITVFTGKYDTRTLLIGIIVDYIFSCLAILGITVILMKRMNIANYRYETLHKQLETEKKVGYLNQVMIKCGNKLFPITIDQVAYFYSENKMNHVVLSKGVTYTIDFTIQDLELKLDPNIFFRVSRGCIVAKSAVVSISTIENGRLAIETTPKNENSITVSRARVNDFMSWMQ